MTAGNIISILVDAYRECMIGSSQLGDIATEDVAVDLIGIPVQGCSAERLDRSAQVSRR
jgi:hypothetical protein